MQFVYFCALIDLLVVSVTSQPTSCRYGYFTYDSANNCMFDCEYSGGTNYLDPLSLSFDFIAEQCDSSVGIPARMGFCSSVDDLVYATDSCGCPSCQCSTPDSTSTAPFETILSKSCLSCTCVAGTPPLYQCSKAGEVESPYNWGDFTCPPIECVDTVSRTAYYPGDSWFADKDTTVNPSAQCDTFCYCDASGTSQCEVGFDAIINSNTQDLVDAFYEQCNYGLEDCSNDGSRMIGQTPTCHEWSCPKCDCGTHSVGDAAWFTEHEDFESPDASSCSQCRCESGVPNYAECDSMDRYPINSNTDSCPGPQSVTCHNADGYSDCTGSDCTARSTTNQTLKRELCATNAPEAHCGWTYNADASYESWDWGCDSSTFCSIYGATNECFYYQMSVDYTDCNGVTQTRSLTQYQYCCNTADCNFVDIDIATCSENTRTSEVMQSMWTCVYSDYANSFGGCDPLLQTQSTCAAVGERFETQLNCMCGVYRMLYQDSSPAWQPWIEELVNLAFANMNNVNEWNRALGCSINLQCDVTVTAEPTLSTPDPTLSPTQPSQAPTGATLTPTGVTSAPTQATANPSQVPTIASLASTTAQPTEETDAPTHVPTADTDSPTDTDTANPSSNPSVNPSSNPSAFPLFSSTWLEDPSPKAETPLSSEVVIGASAAATIVFCVIILYVLYRFMQKKKVDTAMDIMSAEAAKQESVAVPGPGVHIDKWTTDDVYGYLSTVNDGTLVELAESFKAEAVTGRALSNITDDDLLQIGVSLGNRVMFREVRNDLVKQFAEGESQEEEEEKDTDVIVRPQNNSDEPEDKEGGKITRGSVAKLAGGKTKGTSDGYHDTATGGETDGTLIEMPSMDDV